MITRNDLVDRELSPSEARDAFQQLFTALADRIRNGEVLQRAGAAIVCCSWCHEGVAIVQKPQLCPQCGHQADVARADCHCAACTMGRRA